jgi:1-acyl-sn-glycerol-3-phosphate acyltransferase
MGLIKKIIQYSYCVYAMFCFVVIMFMVLPFVIILSPMGVAGGNGVYRLCNIWARLWYGCIGIKHKEIYEAPHDRNRQYIFTVNHCSYMDIPALVRCMHQPIRVLGKYEMVKYPVFGIIYKAAAILVDRSSAEKRAKSVRALKAALNHGISIFIFPEGTFNETENPLKDFYDGAFRIAIETQTPIKPILFIDTIKRMHWKSIFSLSPGKNRVIFLEEIPVHTYTMKEVQVLKSTVYQIMEQAIIKYRAQY